MHSPVRLFFLSLLTVFLLAACTDAAPVVLFDESHKQAFLIGKNDPLDLSDLAGLYQAEGFTVASRSESLTEKALDSVDVLVISGPFQPLAEDEVEAVINFVKAGGGLAVMLHIAPPVAGLLERLDVDYTNGTLRERNHVIDETPLNFKVNVLQDHPITTGLESFSAYGVWALRGTAPHAVVLAETSPKAWVDLDRDNRFSGRDAEQSFGVMVAGELDRGRYVVFGDDAIFQNRFFDENNRQLALQMLDWLAKR